VRQPAAATAIADQNMPLPVPVLHLPGPSFNALKWRRLVFSFAHVSYSPGLHLFAQPRADSLKAGPPYLPRSRFFVCLGAVGTYVGGQKAPEGASPQNGLFIYQPCAVAPLHVVASVAARRMRYSQLPAPGLCRHHEKCERRLGAKTRLAAGCRLAMCSRVWRL
jgi:hypothetical protein